jgi:Ser/Thr protein kinase RdoA (MazF antagonist)
MERLGDLLKLLPAHGDLSAQNIFVSDGQPWIIDWDNAGHHQPMLQDPLYLIIRESELGRIDLLTAFLAGNFDTELHRIFALNGLSNAPCPNLVLLIHAYLIHFHNKRAAGQRDADERNVDILWKPLLVYCADYL